jgi:hypothetical protein
MLISRYDLYSGIHKISKITLHLKPFGCFRQVFQPDSNNLDMLEGIYTKIILCF